MRNRPAQALEVLWLVAALAVPLAFNPWGANGFELPKALLLRALALWMGLAALAQFLTAGRRGFRKPASPLLWAALVFGLALIAATALSVNPRVSLWGSYERQQGLLTQGAYLALFLLTAASLHTRAQVERLWAALVWGSAPVVVYGLAQAAGLDPLDWRTDAASPVLSTIGRANFLGSYLVLVIPLTLGFVVRTLRSRGAEAPTTNRLTWLLLPAQLACLALTQARGAWIGTGVGMLVFALAWATATRNKRLAAAALIATLLTASLVALLNLPGGPLAALAQAPGLERLATLSRTDAGSTAARITIWRATLPLIAARPWLGYGPETLRPVFARVFPPQLVYYQGRHVTVDRAHNLWLDLALSAGLVGILSFAALLAGFGWLVWRALRVWSNDSSRYSDHTLKTEIVTTNAFQRGLWAALAAAVIGHLVDLQFGFDLTASATVFWLALALASALPLSSSPHPPISPSPPLLIPPTLAALALIYVICARPLLADAAYWQSQQSARALEERLAAARRAVRLWPLEPEYRLGLAWTLLQAGDFAAAEAQIEAAGRLGPADPKIWAARGELYAYWGEIEPGRLAQAEAAYRQALELAPNIATTHTSLGLVLARQGRLEDALAELERAVALDATDGVAYGHLADLYRTLGREEEADWAEKEAERWNDQ